MKKVPTLFERDWDDDRRRVTPAVHRGCEWVLAGEGFATRKLDGTCCMVRGNRLYKRRELREGEAAPPNFEEADFDDETQKTVGWVPVGEGPEDKWHRAAWTGADRWPDGTYELIGPKVQGNPEHQAAHLLIKHGGGPAGPLEDVPRSFGGLRKWLATQNIEGVVFHHPHGQMAKIKGRDFGIKRPR